MGSLKSSIADLVEHGAGDRNREATPTPPPPQGGKKSIFQNVSGEDRRKGRVKHPLTLEHLHFLCIKRT